MWAQRRVRSLLIRRPPRITLYPYREHREHRPQMQINTAAQQPTHRNTDTQSLFRHAGQRTQATNTEQRDHYATPQVNGIFERNKQESYRTTSLTNSCPWARTSSTNQNEPPPAPFVAGTHTSTPNNHIDTIDRTAPSQPNLDAFSGPGKVGSTAVILGSGLLFDALTDQPRGGLVQRANAHYTRPHSAFKLENTLAL